MSLYASAPPTVTPEEARAKLQASIDRAVARAIEMADSGVRPVLRRSETSGDGLHTLQRWVVPSRTTAGSFHVVTLISDCDGLRTECSCPAGQAEPPRPCWHRALARRCAMHQAPYTDGRRSAPAISLTKLHGRPTRNTVLVGPDGAGVAPDPWDVEAFAAIS